MDGVSSEANEENDNRERPIRRRHSSILKPPRSPLQDLRNGNETAQESNTLRNKKSSRRVSFADTIKVFQTESHMKVVRKSEIMETEAGENVLCIQNKNSEDNYCEITGMNTLLCAPIQTQMQQREFPIIEYNHERKHGGDQTVIFSDENQMDLTASHTVMITKGRLDCTKSEKSTKIDTRSFLANLKHNAEDSRIKNELKLSMDQKTLLEKKINSSDFIKRLKTGKYSASPFTGPDKENSEILIYPKESDSASSTHQMHVPFKVDENSSNMTGIFQEQDEGMNFTHCHTVNIQTLVPTTSEANLRAFKGDTTIYGNDCMDLTVNRTVQILPSADNLSEKENQTQTVELNVTTVCEAPGKETFFQKKINAVVQDSSLNPQDKIHITRSHITESETQTVTQTPNQGARTLTVTPESIYCSPDIQGYKTVYYSSCNDAMELTKCLSSLREEKNLPKHDDNSKMCANPDGIPLLIEETIYSGEDSMDITKSHTVAIDNQIVKQDQAHVQIAAASISEKEMMLQSCITVSEDEKMNVSCSSVANIFKERLQQSLTKPLSISSANQMTELLASEDMDLTESHTSNLGSHAPLASYALVTKNTSESHYQSKSPLDEWGKNIKSHIKPSQQPNISKNILSDIQSKEKYQLVKFLPHLNKDPLPSTDYNQDTAINHNIVYSGAVLDEQVVLGNNRQTVLSEQSLFSTTKPSFASEGQSAVKNHDTAENSHLVKSKAGQYSKLTEPLRKNLDDPIPNCSHDKMAVCVQEDQTMDLTKSHTVVIGFGPSELQELSETNLAHRTSQFTAVNKQVATEVEKCDKSPVEKTDVFMSNDRDVLDDKSIQKPGFEMEKQNVNIHGRRSIGGLKIDKTIVFSEGDENDMDITKSYTVEINQRPLLDKHDSHLAGTSKMILYACCQDDMEITGSHTTALECKTPLPSEKTSRQVDKTVMFVDSLDELEMTKSHTVFIDYQTQERTVLPDTSTFELGKRKSLQKSEVAATAEDDRVFYTENNESDHPTAKHRQLTGLEKWSNVDSIKKGVVVKADDSMEVSKLTSWENTNDVQKPGKSQRRKSLRLKNDKTIAFSENDKSEMNITQSCVVEMSNRSALEDKEDFNLVPLTGISKTILYSCGHDDMEITASHTTASDCKTVLPDEITRPMDKTVMFVDNCNDLEVTKSHTVFIDCQATEKMLQEYPKFGMARGKNLSVYFPKDDSYVQETIEKQALTIENKVSLHPKQKHHDIPLNPTSTLSGNHSEMEIKFYRAALDEEVMEKVVDQACTLEKAKIESCHLNRTNVDFISSSVAAVGGSIDKEKASDYLVQNDLACAGNLVSKYYLDSEGLPLSASCSLLEKKEAIGPDSRGQLNCAMTLLKDEDKIKKPQNLLANQTLVNSQNLGEMTKLNSKRVSFKLPKDQMEAFVDDICDASQPHLSTHQLPLAQNRQSVVYKAEAILSKSGNKSLNFITENSSAPTYENESKMLNNEKQFAIACKKELQENNQTAKCNTAIDFHSNSNSTTQTIQTYTNVRDASDHIITSNAPCLSSTKPNTNNLNGKTEEFLDSQTVHIPPQEELLELGNKAHSNMSIMQPTEMHGISIASTNAKDNWDEENKNSHDGADTTSVPLKMIVKDKMKRCSLGIFLPKLPNKRNCSIIGIDDLEQIPADTTDLNHLEIKRISSKDSDIESVAANLNLSPSEYINEENLPICPGEINSSDTISIEIEEKALIENKMEEACNNQKRTWVQEDDDVQNEKKIIKYDIKLGDTIQDQEIFDHHTEGDIDRNVNSVLIKSLNRTPSSCSSSLDSIKADGTSLDFSTNRNNQMESQFLRDTICEENLREKLKDGRITIREFFILLQVHILIQKPRQSNLPAKFTTNTSPTSEDLILRQYVYGPKIQIYREDCEILRQKIEELKISSLTQDKLLTDVNKNLWEKMRHFSDEELKAFGIYLTKIKSRVTKVTKVFTHQGKVTLYSKLLQSAQDEREKLQIRINEMDNILKKINNYLSEVEIETKNLEEEKDNLVEEWDSEMRAAEKELEQLKTEEEELQRKLLELEVQKEQTLAQIDFMQKQSNRTEELLNELSLSEWDVIEWTDDQAIFTFVYDTIELTITFGEPVVGLPFLDKAYKKITDLNFQSLLDEDKAPPSSLLVHKLIFQYIEKQESWKKKCTTQHQVPKMLQELSTIVNHCRLLGEEIEFLKRWGPSYNLMDIDVNNTELKLLFSSSAAFAKFAVTLSLSAQYPLVPLPFTIQNHLGNTGQDEIAAIISKVPLAENYLKNIVKQIYQDLLQGCHFYC